MSYFTDDEFWDLRGRGGATNMFVGSCFHLLESTEILREAEAKNLTPDIRAALVGVAVSLVSMARSERVGDFSIRFVDYSPEGFGVVIEAAEDRFPESFLAVFAAEVTFANRELKFRISKSRLESMVADWLARRRPTAPSK